VVNRAAVLEREPASAVEQAARSHRNLDRGAQRGPPGQAELALAASRPPHQDHGVAGLEPADFGAGLLDDSGALVPEHDRQPAGQVAVQVMQVAVADADGLDAHQHLAGPRLGQPRLLQPHRLTHGVQHGRLHSALPLAFRHFNLKLSKVFLELAYHRR